MISLNQILLLEQKVESAVAKIAQLQAENDALRSKCSELTNSLSSKTEQLSNFESNQDKIESGILKALDRLNSIENSVLNASGQVSSEQTIQEVQTSKTTQDSQTIENPAPVQNSSITTTVDFNNMQNVQPKEETSTNQEEQIEPVQQEQQTQQEVQERQEQQEQPLFADEGTPLDEDENGQFDIF